ncbi:uncharacterized protein LOC134856006 [Symsagittifera roscoffensis]|uniref:uncharacterized protein LOC134856006 n=1 Tax=Symsagittifera roscoffensis TaxID=84072 RepID=UPI00307C5B5E
MVGNSISEERSLLVAVACTRIPQIADYFGPKCPNQKLFAATAKLIDKAKHENAKRTLNDIFNSDSNWKRLKNGRLSFKHLSSYNPSGNPPKNRGKYLPKSSSLVFLKNNKDDQKCPILWFKLSFFIRELSDLKKNTASSRFYTESRDALVEMCEVFCTHLMQQVHFVLESFWELCEMGSSAPYVPPRNSQQGVICSKNGLKTLNQRAEPKERLLLECFLKTQIAVESLGFEMPPAYSDFVFSLGIRSYSLSYFSAMLNGGVFKLSPHSCRRVFEELDENQGVNDQSPSSNDDSSSKQKEVFSFKHDILLRYDSLCPLADIQTVVNWEPGKRICQEMALMKKLSEVTGYFDRGPLPAPPNPFPSFGSSTSLGSSESSESFDKAESPEGGPSVPVDLVSEARTNFRAYISSKLGKNNASQYFVTPPPGENTTSQIDDSLWFYD